MEGVVLRNLLSENLAILPERNFVIVALFRKMTERFKFYTYAIMNLYLFHYIFFIAASLTEELKWYVSTV